jgi:outer membrane protein assembly factor BamD (BamD/ComL family)
MEAESAYNLGHYARAQDRYSELLADYPSSRHLDDVSKRLFEIARMWLDFPEPATVGEVAQVNYDDFGNELPAPQPIEKTKSNGPAFWPNLTDKSRPLFDPEGNGVGALRLIWLNDPTGPLADDALMLAASHYARAGNYIEADRHYTLLREEYPNSPHVQTAFVLGSHVKLMSYEGPEYDHKALEDSEHLKESILRLYPEMQDRDRIQGELDKIELAKAAREWELVVFYNKKGNPRAEAIYCHLLLQRYPETPFAKLARERLAELGPEYAGGTALLNPQPDPPKYRQTFGRNRPQLTNTPSSARQTPVAEETAEQPAEESRRWGNPFRRGADGEAAPTETEPEETSPAPRRFLPWGGDEDAEPIPTPDSPGDEAEERRAETASDESEAGEGGSRWSRMFRFTPPRRLTPSREAEPIEDAAEAEMEADSTETAVDPESEFEE